MVAGWKRQIYAARNGVSIAEWTKAWAKEIREASTTANDDSRHTDRQEAEIVLSDQLEDLVQAHRLTLRSAKAAFEIATGHHVILAYHDPGYLRKYRNHNIKTQSAYRSEMDRFVKEFGDDEQVTTKSIERWVTKMADEENLAAQTIQRMIGQAQTFWSYLVELEIVKREANPFTAFKLTVPKPEEIVEIL
jgi:hypothetical protein